MTEHGVAGVEKLESPTIENLFRLAPGLYSGGQPDGEAGLDALRDMGVRTIISVDGTPPPVEAARKLGIRYVHLPIGYDGLRRDKLPIMIKAVRELPGPVFIHCHHGKHRGPAAAAACAIARNNWSRPEAEAWLKIAGTDPAYRGLYRDVRELAIPTVAETKELPAVFPESVPAPSLVEAMLGIDRLHDELKGLAKREWKNTNDARTAPPEIAVQLLEAYRELSRNSDSERQGSGFQGQLKTAEQAADALRVELEQLAKSPDSKETTMRANQALDRVSKSCKTCHGEYRDK
ncbi:MAG: cytochrome c [Planctomycetota bacterium]|nr:cytochrome c [Planctomycetota bacterium]